MGSSESSVTAQTVLDQKIGQAAAAATLSKCLLLEAIHHTAGQRDVESFRLSRFGDLRCCDIGCHGIAWITLQLFAQLFQKTFQD